MPKRPHWTDKYIAKQSFGAIVRVPGNEVTGGPEEPVARSGLALWMREHRLTSYVLIVFVLPALAYSAALAFGLTPAPRLLVAFVPSILIATWFVTRR